MGSVMIPGLSVRIRNVLSGGVFPCAQNIACWGVGGHKLVLARRKPKSALDKPKKEQTES
jgi:hypothetical protein